MTTPARGTYILIKKETVGSTIEISGDSREQIVEMLADIFDQDAQIGCPINSIIHEALEQSRPEVIAIELTVPKIIKN